MFWVEGDVIPLSILTHFSFLWNLPSKREGECCI